MATALAEAHMILQERLRAALVAGVASAWLGLPGYDEDDVPTFLGRVVPLVLGAQHQAARATDAYIARSLERQPRPSNISAVTGAAVRAGAEPAQVYRRPFVNVWTDLDRGKPYQAAISAGLARATELARTDAQLAHRAALQQAQLRDPTILQWRRVPDGGACAYCRMIAGAKVNSADAMPLHPGCGCTLEPITSGYEPVTETAPQDGVSIREHGELGPVLVSPDHAFTTLP